MNEEYINQCTVLFIDDAFVWCFIGFVFFGGKCSPVFGEAVIGRSIAVFGIGKVLLIDFGATTTQ